MRSRSPDSQAAGLHLCSVGLERDLRICVSSELPGAAGAVAHTGRTVAPEQLVLRLGCLLEDLGVYKINIKAWGPPSETLMKLAWDGAQVIQTYSQVGVDHPPL